MKKFFTILLILPILLPFAVNAQESFLLAQADEFGIYVAANQAGLSAVPIAKKQVPQIMADAVGLGLTFLGIIIFALMLYAGVNWMIAMGASEKVDTAKQTLEAAIIGLLIVIAAYAITSFVFNRIIGVSVGTASSDTTASCTDKTDGQSCGTVAGYVCNYGSCITECEDKYASGQCKDISKTKTCPTGETVAENLCPTLSSSQLNKCCHKGI